MPPVMPISSGKAELLPQEGKCGFHVRPKRGGEMASLTSCRMDKTELRSVEELAVSLHSLVFAAVECIRLFIKDVPFKEFRNIVILMK